MREGTIKPSQTGLNDWVAEEAEANAEGDTLGEHVGRSQEGNSNQRYNDSSQTQAVELAREGGSRRQSICEALPGIGNIGKTVHDRPHLAPHSRLHGYLCLVVCRGGFLSFGRRLCGACTHGNGGRIRDAVGHTGLTRWRLRLWVLSTRTGKSDGRNAVDEVAGFGLCGFTLVFFWSTSSCVGTA